MTWPGDLTCDNPITRSSTRWFIYQFHLPNSEKHYNVIGASSCIQLAYENNNKQVMCQNFGVGALPHSTLKVGIIQHLLVKTTASELKPFAQICENLATYGHSAVLCPDLIRRGRQLVRFLRR